MDASQIIVGLLGVIGTLVGVMTKIVLYIRSSYEKRLSEKDHEIEVLRREKDGLDLQLNQIYLSVVERGLKNG